MGKRLRPAFGILRACSGVMTRPEGGCSAEVPEKRVVLMRYPWFGFLVLVLSSFAMPASGFAQTPAFQGSVGAAAPTDQPLPLSLDDALQRGLRYNLGNILS